jgi:hypothetical protein
MRRLRRPPARKPLTLSGIVFVSTASAGKGRLLRPIDRRQLLDRLESSQAYAASQPHWKTFLRRASRLPALELRRGRHPAEGVEALRALLAE